MKSIRPIYQRDWRASEVKYFLRKWYDYDQHLNDLSEFDRACVIELYTRLSYLTSEERETLARKYHKPTDKRLTDPKQAKSVGIELNDYILKRSETEKKLRRHRRHPAAGNTVFWEIEKLLKNGGD